MLFRRIFFLVLALGVLAPSMAAAALPAGELWRENLLNHRVGYGRNATGGAGGSLCTVTNLNDTGAGSLRNCLMLSGPQWVIFSVSGTINLATPIQATPTGGNDKTIDGRGATITISADAGAGVALYLSGLSNWIIHNVAMTTQGSFIMRMFCAQTIWLDHLDITGSHFDMVSIGIGATGGWCADNTTPSTNITISWSKFHDRGDGSGMILFGTTDPETIMANARLTMHHNYYQHGADARFPYMRYGRTHSFNNYQNNVDQGAQVTVSGQLNSENDIFECVTTGDGHDCGASGNPLRVMCNFTSVPDGANCKVTNPWLMTGTETYEQFNAGTTFNPASDYSYTLETANAALRTKLITYAGPQALQAPIPVITAPNGGANTTGTSPLTTLAGTASDDTGVTEVTWSCPTCTPASGTATCPTCGSLPQSMNVTWSVASIGLAPGANVITVTAKDDDTLSSTDAITVTVTGTTAATITTPTSGATYSTGTTPLTTLAGGASDDVGVISVTWACPTCTPLQSGTATCVGCGAAGTSVSWSVASIGLAAGANVITVTATDANTNTGQDVLTVTLTTADITSNLVALYKFNDAAGTATDSTGHGLTGTFIGGATYGAGAPSLGQGLALNGTSQAVSVADDPQLDLTGAYTLAAWVFPTSTLTTFAAAVVKNYTYYLYAGSNICGAGSVLAGHGSNDVCVATPLTANTWTHIAATYDGTVLQLYVNFTPVGTPTTPAVAPVAGTGTLELGTSQYSEFFPGRLDEVRIYSRGLTAADLTLLGTVTDAPTSSAPVVLRLVR